MSMATLSAWSIEFAIGNLALAMPLALIAWCLQQRGTQPFLAHLFWLVVLVKLVTPPLYSVSIAAPPATPPMARPLPSVPLPGDAAPFAPAADPSWLSTLDWRVALVFVWLAGSLLVLGWLLTRALRFNRLLRLSSAKAAPEYQQIASRLAATLGLKRAPPVMATAARISPMVWWIGGRVRVYLPRSMVEQLSHTELCDILAHELGHVGRGDHYVRWLECAVGVVLWWNPVAWWARRNLRVCEEVCCDAFVLAKTEASPDAYAGALVSAMELLVAPTIRPSGMASHVNGGFIERRIRMILSGQTVIETPRWLRGLVLASAALILPLGFTLAQDGDDSLQKARQWIESGVNSAFLTQEQADIMLRALEASQHRFAVSYIDENGNVVTTEGAVNLQGEDVRVLAKRLALDATAQRDQIEHAIVFAENHFADAVAAGTMTQAEAAALMADLQDAMQRGPTAPDRTVYYEQQFESGLIDRAEMERRKALVEELEQAWNASGMEAMADTQSIELVKVIKAPPGEFVAGEGKPARVELRIGEPIQAEWTLINVPRVEAVE